MSFHIPIVLLTFNRPQKTYKVFERIRQIRPSLLLVSCDGPRDNHPEDIAKCNAVKNIFEEIDWNCNLITNYSSTNEGSYKKNSSSLSWAFETVDKAIILEDDCVPDVSFFYFCQELLERYKDDPRIMLISGNNFQFNHNYGKDSYFFSRYTHIWGWAAWKRTWSAVDLEMRQWPKFRDQDGLYSVLKDKTSVRYFKKIFDDMYLDRRRHSWDYKLQLAVLMQGAFAITPNVNLVRNIGFDLDAVHYKNPNDIFSHIPERTVSFPLSHPDFIVPNHKNDKYLSSLRFSFYQRLNRKVKSILHTYKI